MNVLHLISSSGFYGAESMLLTLARASSRLGCNLSIGVFEDSRDPHTEVGELASQAGLAVRAVPCKGRWDWQAVNTIRMLLKDSRAKILHTHGYKADLYGYMACRNHTAARVSTCHNWPDPKVRMQAYAALDRFALRGFEAITTPSCQVAQILERSGIPSAKLSWIRNGVDLGPFFHPEPALRRELNCGDRPIVGFVGRSVAEKGGATLLHAARYVLSAGFDALFVFVGDGPCQNEWRTLAGQLGIGSHVIFAGTRRDMPGVYGSFDMFVLPSFDEAMPMSILEAMSAAKPVVATPVGSVPDLVLHGKTGFLCEPGNVEELGKSITTLLGNPRLARTLGDNARDLVSNEYSSDVMARRYMDVYQSAAAGCMSLRRAS